MRVPYHQRCPPRLLGQKGLTSPSKGITLVLSEEQLELVQLREAIKATVYRVGKISQTFMGKRGCSPALKNQRKQAENV